MVNISVDREIQERKKLKEMYHLYAMCSVYLHFLSCNNRIKLLHHQWQLLQAHIFLNLSDMYLSNKEEKNMKNIMKKEKLSYKWKKQRNIMIDKTRQFSTIFDIFTQ